MTASEFLRNRRILIVDDNEAIHLDFRKILAEEVVDSRLDQDETLLFGGRFRMANCDPYKLHSAFQGEEAIDMTKTAFQQGCPYAIAFVDVRMPSGRDGVETVERLWEEDPSLHIVICTAYSEYSWDEVVGHLGITDRLLILKQRFDRIQVRQLAAAFTEKWHLARNAQLKLHETAGWGVPILEKMIAKFGDERRFEHCLREVGVAANDLVDVARQIRDVMENGVRETRARRPHMEEHCSFETV